MALEVHSPGLRLIQFTKFNSNLYLYIYIYTYYLHMFIDVHSQEVIGKISMARLPQLPPEKMIRLKPSSHMVDLKSPGENIRQYKVGPSSSVCWLKLFTTWPWARVLPVERLCHWNLGSLSQHHGQSSFWTLVSLFSDSTRVASRVSGGICGWIRVIGRCSIAISRSCFH